MQQARNSLQIDLRGQNTNAVTNDIGLTNMAAHDVMVSWASSATNFIATNGRVTRPVFGRFDAQVTLTATLYKGMVTNAKTFILTVITAPITDVQAVVVASNDLQIDLRDQNANGITSNIGLTNMAAHGVMVSWSSSNANLIATDGMITRPHFTNGDQRVVLTATLSKGMVTRAKTFTLTVLALPDENIAAVSNARDALQIDLRTQNANAVTNDIGLTNLGTGDVMVSWTSSDTSSIATNGMVTRPVFGRSNQVITLTAILSKGAVTKTKIFSLTVLAEPPTDEQAVEIASNALMIGYGGSDSATDVTARCHATDKRSPWRHGFLDLIQCQIHRHQRQGHPSI